MKLVEIDYDTYVELGKAGVWVQCDIPPYWPKSHFGHLESSKGDLPWGNSRKHTYIFYTRVEVGDDG